MKHSHYMMGLAMFNTPVLADRFFSPVRSHNISLEILKW